MKVVFIKCAFTRLNNVKLQTFLSEHREGTAGGFVIKYAIQQPFSVLFGSLILFEYKSLIVWRKRNEKSPAVNHEVVDYLIYM